MKEESNTEFQFSWADEYSVGIAEVDDQHHNLVNFVQELHQAIKTRRGRAVSIAIIARLAEYTRTHFLFEESLMRVTNYPDAALHKHQHDDLIDKVVTLQDKLIKENIPITFELLHFLKNWLAHHICGSDKEFGLYFQMTSLKKNSAAATSSVAPVKHPWWKFWK